MCSRVLLSSDGSPFVKSVASCLRKLSFETEGCGWSSQKILDALEKVSCDLVCILTIDDYDELRRLVGIIHEKYSSIKILVTISTARDSVAELLRISERVKCAVLPQSPDRIAELVRRILEEKSGSMYSYIADYMYFLGLRKKYDGFRYLCSAVELCVEDSSRLQSIVKVYAEVGEIHGVSGAVVERTLRYLSKAVNEDGTALRVTHGKSDKKMTSSSLISAVYEGFITRRMRVCGKESV